VTPRLLPALACAVLLAGCVTSPPSAAAQRIRGTVVGLDRPEEAHVELFRLTSNGVAQRLHGAEAVPGSDGRFSTSLLLPGRYVLALRAPGRPPSVVTLPVPPAPEVRLVARVADPAASLELRHDVAGAAMLEVVLTRVEDGLPVPDRRRLPVPAGAPLRIDGLTPGRWSLDLVGLGVTTEVDVGAEGSLAAVVLDPPTVGSGAPMIGRVLREDGSPARGVAVTVRSYPEGTLAPSAWGRSTLTDSDGGYRLVGLPSGRVLVRVECREAVQTRLPKPAVMSIPPSGVVRRSFVVGP